MSLTFSPTYPLPGSVRLSSPTPGQVVLTAAPPTSALAEQIGRQIRSVRTAKPTTVDFDVPGVYTGTFGSGSWTLAVGQKVTAPLRIGSASGTLILFVWDSTIRATTEAAHGEDSPRIDGKDDSMKSAAADASVVSALAALDGTSATSLLADLDAAANDLISEANAHFASGAYHTLADTYNAVDASYRDASRATLVEVMSRLQKHATNDSGSGTGSASPDFHNQADWSIPSLSIQDTEIGLAIALAQLINAYEAHRVNTEAHATADTTNTVASSPPLVALLRAVASAVDDPTPAATENAGVVELVAAGFSKG